MIQTKSGTVLVVVFTLFFLLLATKANSLSIDTSLAKDVVHKEFKRVFKFYMGHAFPHDLLLPANCKWKDQYGGNAMTLIDNLDTLIVFGEKATFAHALERLKEMSLPNFKVDVNVNCFESNIRFMGGLLSAHLQAKNLTITDRSGYLLQKAAELGAQLLPAFATPMGIPFGSINFRDGVHPNESNRTSLASAGTYTLEWGMLSKLTKNPVYYRKARGSIDSLWASRTKDGLLSEEINIKSGNWSSNLAGIGGNSDSYFEYLLKSGVMYNDDELLGMFQESRQVIDRYLRFNRVWFRDVSIYNIFEQRYVFSSLMAFWPGVELLSGRDKIARDMVDSYYQMWRKFGGLPEGYKLNQNSLIEKFTSYYLRPELIESIYYLYTKTQDPWYILIAKDILFGLLSLNKAKCGFASRDLYHNKLKNEMDSFFLSETLKYLYLIFDKENFINKGNYIFSTEAHYFPVLPKFDSEKNFKNFKSESHLNHRNPYLLYEKPPKLNCLKKGVLFDPKVNQKNKYKWKSCKRIKPFREKLSIMGLDFIENKHSKYTGVNALRGYSNNYGIPTGFN
ncbi:er degradation-enhancing alpha-mannosidase-like protein [Anaeramoeba flamelloides]|uniref:alpha-1,2-Mannosidase n=1 Tax=Anaeramoeba flamelloides TaxID=1746091 RepID=A0AAV7YJ32_9EUKA|nr:er degradation-enhancing alpha-mannosidase-like protein [Anaeramoeba flamelloides]